MVRLSCMSGTRISLRFARAVLRCERFFVVVRPFPFPPEAVHPHLVRGISVHPSRRGLRFMLLTQAICQNSHRSQTKDKLLVNLPAATALPACSRSGHLRKASADGAGGSLLGSTGSRQSFVGAVKRSAALGAKRHSESKKSFRQAP